MASFTISGLSFINDAVPPPPAIDFSFDSDLQGWALNTFDEPCNVTVHPPVGVRPPILLFTPRDGYPTPGAATLTASFSAFNQYVDAIVNPFPPVNLLGATLHARVRLVAGTLPAGAASTFTPAAEPPLLLRRRP